jgi:hypothetical protein
MQLPSYPKKVRAWSTGTGFLRLIWDGQSDLDLYVEDPPPGSRLNA